MKNILIKRSILPALVLALLPLAASAESLVFKSAKTSYQVGDSFSVSLVLNTAGQSINTLSGQISVPAGKLRIIDVRYGNSIVSLWAERPKADSAAGTITFTGGVPGGFSGSAGPILSFGIKAVREGAAEITAGGMKILLNDGLGTEASNVNILPLNLTIEKASALPKNTGGAAPTPAEIYLPPPDKIPPEAFIPLVSRHPSIAGNKYFVSFSAVDKDSGIAYYEISEEPLLISLFTNKFNLPAVRAESPYVLRGQFWTYKVVVRACDQAGNCAEGYAVKPLSPSVEAVSALIVLAAAVLITRWAYKPRRQRRRMV